MTRQRLAEVLDDRFVADLEGLATDVLRERRAVAEAEEEAVSYVRRLLQGRLDILRAELVRRTDDGNRAAADLLTQLSGVLAADAATERDLMQARATRLRVPEGIEHYTDRLDEIVDAAVLDELQGRTVPTLESFIEELAVYEHELSQIRRRLFERIDALRGELAARYKDGRAVIGDLLAEH